MFEGVNAVIDLAGISNDPSCEIDPELTRAVNFDGGVSTMRLARDAGAERFILASSWQRLRPRRRPRTHRDLRAQPRVALRSVQGRRRARALRPPSPGLPCNHPSARHRLRALPPHAFRPRHQRHDQERLHPRPDHRRWRRKAVASLRPRRRRRRDHDSHAETSLPRASTARSSTWATTTTTSGS